MPSLVPAKSFVFVLSLMVSQRVKDVLARSLSIVVGDLLEEA